MAKFSDKIMAKFSDKIRLKNGCAALVFGVDGTVRVHMNERSDGAATGAQMAALALFKQLSDEPELLQELIQELMTSETRSGISR